MGFSGPRASSAELAEWFQLDSDFGTELAAAGITFNDLRAHEPRAAVWPQTEVSLETELNMAGISSNVGPTTSGFNAINLMPDDIL